MGTQLPKKGHSSPLPLFGPCLLWPNGWMDRDATWYRGRSHPTPHCVRWGPSSHVPRKGHSSPSTFRPMSIVAKRQDGSGCLRWTQLPPESNGRASHLLPSSCCTAHRKVSSYVTMRRYVSPASKIAPSPFGDRVPHVTHGAYGLTESSPQTASRLVQPFLYGCQMLYCTMHCHWGRKPPKLPLLLGISSPCRRRTEPHP